MRTARAHLFVVMLLLLLAGTSQAAGLPPVPGPGQDWLTDLANDLTNLTTANGGALTQVGLIELSFISFFVLVSMVIRWSISGMTLNFHHQPLRLGDLTLFLVRLALCCIAINYWVTPLPGSTFSLNHIFSYFAQVIVSAIDQGSLDQLLKLLKEATDGTPTPTNPIDIGDWFTFFDVHIILGFMNGILFMINSSAFVFYGVSALFGPIFIPFYMAASLRGKFFGFVDALLSFAMIRAVASAFIYVWEQFLNTWYLNTFHGVYSLEMWLAHIMPMTAIMLAFLLNMLFIPKITQILFGGGAGAADKIGTVVEAATLGLLL